MSRLDVLKRRNDVRRLIRMSNRHRNVLRWSPNETDAHVQMKLEICKHLLKCEEEFYTEAIFEDGSGRADIVASDRGVIIEVVESEGQESIMKKRGRYPLPLIVVRAGQEFREELIQ